MDTKKDSTSSRRGRASTTPDAEPEKLGYYEVKALCQLIAEEFINMDGTPALDALMILADDLHTRCQDYLHAEFIGMALQYALFTASGEADAPMRATVQAYREKMKRGELRRRVMGD